VEAGTNVDDLLYIKKYNLKNNIGKLMNEYRRNENLTSMKHSLPVAHQMSAFTHLRKKIVEHLFKKKTI